jgi:hypothetical protein
MQNVIDEQYAEIEQLREALVHIGRGDISKEATTAIIDGSWNPAYQDLQAIALAALKDRTTLPNKTPEV